MFVASVTEKVLIAKNTTCHVSALYSRHEKSCNISVIHCAYSYYVAEERRECWVSQDLSAIYYRRTPLIRTLVIRIGLTLRVNLLRILQN